MCWCSCKQGGSHCGVHLAAAAALSYVLAILKDTTVSNKSATHHAVLSITWTLCVVCCHYALSNAFAGSSNMTSSSFCNSCICSIQSTLDTIIKTREALLSGSTAAKNGDDEYRGCYVILTQALVEGDVLTPEAAGVLGSEQCRSFTQQTPAERRAACKKESAPKAPPPANNGTESQTSAGSIPKPPTERSAGSTTGFGGLGGTVVACLVALVAAWVTCLAH